MEITFDPVKRDRTLAERGLDFRDALTAFASPSLPFQDVRFDYPEPRFVTVGYLVGRMIIVVWTPVDDKTHVIIHEEVQCEGTKPLSGATWLRSMPMK